MTGVACFRRPMAVVCAGPARCWLWIAEIERIGL